MGHFLNIAFEMPKFAIIIYNNYQNKVSNHLYLHFYSQTNLFVEEGVVHQKVVDNKLQLLQVLLWWWVVAKEYPWSKVKEKLQTCDSYGQYQAYQIEHQVTNKIPTSEIISVCEACEL